MIIPLTNSEPKTEDEIRAYFKKQIEDTAQAHREIEADPTRNSVMTDEDNLRKTIFIEKMNELMEEWIKLIE